jgi:hypothetical protein
MFSVYIDDSGTDPNQKVAIATGMIIPAPRIAALDREWDKFKQKEQFECFHTSPCLAGNQKEGFGAWDQEKKTRVLRRVRRIAKKYAAKAFSLAINKSDYEEVMPREFVELGGQYHYTWAIRNLLMILDAWAIQSSVTTSFEYIYHWMDPKAQKIPRQEIETVMAQAEDAARRSNAGRTYVNYSFRRDEEIPALQCVDAVGWAAYQSALKVFVAAPVSELAIESFSDFHRADGSGWLVALTISKEHLRDWVERERADGRGLERLKAWMRAHPSKTKKTMWKAV